MPKIELEDENINGNDVAGMIGAFTVGIVASPLMFAEGLLRGGDWNDLPWCEKIVEAGWVTGKFVKKKIPDIALNLALGTIRYPSDSDV